MGRKSAPLPLLFVTLLLAAGCSDVAGSSPAGVEDDPGLDVNTNNGGVNNGLDDMDPDDVDLDPEADPTAEPEPVPEGEPEGEVADCFSVAYEANRATRPVDIVWVIDASPSMGDEIEIIEANLNDFADRIGGSGLDYRVVLIGSDRDMATPERDYFGICVPEPLSGAPGCPDTDSERYLHVRRGVHSSDGLDIAAETYAQWAPFLRSAEGSNVHFVMVTDDNVGWGMDAQEWGDFILGATAPGFPNGATFHSIVDLVGYEPGCAFDDSCSCGDERGQAYIDLSEQSEGLVLSVCEEDWTPIFEALEEEVIDGTAIECGFEIPEVEEGQRIDYDRVNVVFVGNDDSRELIPQVNGEQDCARTPGWYYDDPDNAQVIHLCEGACERDPERVELELGCETVKY